MMIQEAGGESHGITVGRELKSAQARAQEQVISSSYKLAKIEYIAIDFKELEENLFTFIKLDIIMTAAVETAIESTLPVAATAVLAVLAGSLLLKHKRSRAHTELCAKVKQERAERQHECLRLHGTKPAACDAEILKKTAVELCKAMRSGELKCEAVMLAFIRRSRSVGLLQLNCVTEELYDEAWSTAKGLDESGALLSSNADELPLLGLPVSIKDCLDQSGALSTCGLACRAALRHDKDGLLVQLMRTGGAIPFVRSNVPQLLMMSETDNRYGL
jgi:Amidase